ncbi:MAG: hypothetical protein J6T10_01780 [Methanobrevibacter sp.]|nr:hypothetical protein [Methanobrevibacter sp.]
MADTTYTAVDFSELPSADNGKTLIYKDGQVCQSNEDLSSLIGKQTSGYATQEWVNNKLDSDYYNVDEVNECLDEKLFVSSFSAVSGTFLTAVDIPESATWNDVSNTVQTNSADWASHQDLSYLATKEELNAGLNEVKQYADEGIQEIANGLNDLTDYVDTGFSNIENAIDDKLDTTAFETVSGDFLTSADLDNYYTKSETSGASEISTALNGKQDNLTFAGENNTITAINNSAVGSQAIELTAGTDLVINNGIIGVNTTSTAVGNYAFVAGEDCYASDYGDTFACGEQTSAIGYASHTEGFATIANLDCAHAEGYMTSALGHESHAEGWKTIAGENGDTHAEGSCSQAIGWCSHAEGNSTLASGSESHTEGSETSAIGFASHAEGESTIANETDSHAEGYATSALGNTSHAEGWCTIANDTGMHVQGKYNKTSANAAFVIGNGTEDNDVVTRSDAFIVDWNGNVSATGDMYTSAGQVVTDVMLTSATNSSASFVTNGVADLTSLYTYIKSLEDRIAALEAAQGGDGFTVNGIQPTVNGNTITVGE